MAERISIGVNLSATRAWGKGYNVVSGTDAAKKEITAFYLMPQFRYDYLVSRNWHLFGHVDLGAGYWTGRKMGENLQSPVCRRTGSHRRDLRATVLRGRGIGRRNSYLRLPRQHRLQILTKESDEKDWIIELGSAGGRVQHV